MPNKLVGLRLSDDIIQSLNIIAHNNNLTINAVAKNAIIEYLEIFTRTRQQGMIILGKPLIKNLIESADINEIKSLAQLTAKRKVDFYQFVIEKHLNKDSLDDFIKYTPKLLGNSGLMWFEHVEAIIESNSVHFKCIHEMGEKWSRFSTYFFNFLMKEYMNMELNEESFKFTNSSLYLEYML